MERDLFEETEISDTVDLPENFETYNLEESPLSEQQDSKELAADSLQEGVVDSISQSSSTPAIDLVEQLLSDPRLATQFQVAEIQKQNQSYALMAVCLNGLLETMQQQNIILSDLSKQLGNIEQVGILLVQLGQVFAGNRDA